MGKMKSWYLHIVGAVTYQSVLSLAFKNPNIQLSFTPRYGNRKVIAKVIDTLKLMSIEYDHVDKDSDLSLRAKEPS